MVLTKENPCVYLVFLKLSVSDFLGAILCIGQIIHVHACNWKKNHEILNMKVNLIYCYTYRMFVGDEIRHCLENSKIIISISEIKNHPLNIFNKF